MDDRTAAEAVYERLWADALAAFAEGAVRTDPHLNDRAGDRRRGLTLILRPTPPAIGHITVAIEELNAIAPGQHVYRPDELHITVLSLISASEAFEFESVPAAAYRALLAEICAKARPFVVQYTGLGASPDSVFVCGQTGEDEINVLRNRLRERLALAGLDGAMECRYPSITAHSTILRYCSQPPDLPRLAAYLSDQRAHDLGTFQAEQVEFVLNDWYMSRECVQVLGRYHLGQGGT